MVSPKETTTVWVSLYHTCHENQRVINHDSGRCARRGFEMEDRQTGDLGWSFCKRVGRDLSVRRQTWDVRRRCLRSLSYTSTSIPYYWVSRLIEEGVRVQYRVQTTDLRHTEWYHGPITVGRLTSESRLKRRGFLCRVSEPGMFKLVCVYT